MMITIHGLPKYVKYQDLKQIIRQECKISDFILDNLLIDTNDLKKVRVGLADDNEGAHVIKCLNGYRLSGHILQVAPVGKSGNPVQNNYVDQSTSVSWNNQTQWTNPVAPQQNSYPFQQPQQIGNYLSTVPNQQLRTQVNERPSILSRIGPPSQGFSIAQKNSPNPSSQTRPSYFRTVELIDTSTLQQGRHAESNYDLSQDKSQNPVLKEALNIRGTSIGTQNPGHYQTSNPWNQQFKREQINEKVHPFNETQKPQFSQGRVQDIAAGRIDSSGRNIPLIPTASNRFNTSERPSPTNRHISPQDTRTSSARRISPPSRRMSPPGRRMSPSVRRISPSSRHMSPSSRRMSPSSRRMSPSSRRMSPSSRRMSPSGRQPSPSRRPSPPCRRPSPLVRNMSPPSRRVSPFRRRFSPSSRRESPSMRDVSPNRVRVSSGRNMIQTERPQSPSGARPVQGRMSPRRFSPSERNIYHERRISPSSFKEHLSREGPRSRSPKKGITSGQHRYSPTRNFQKDLRAAKEVRPAYEPSSATTEAMYADGFRPIDKLQYTQGREDRIDRWSNREQKIRKVHDEERGRMTKFEPARPMEIPRIIEKELKRSRSRNRESRSPRRDRSPLRDRYKRHSPSPRSPRRSWALEKRRSPEDAKVPPPPSWPVEESQRMKDCHDKRQSYSKRIDEPRGPVWDINKYESKFEDQRDNRSGDDRRNFEHANIASRKDAAKWKAVGNDSPKRTPPRYNPEKNERTLRRNEVDARHEERRHEESRMRLNRREFEENRREPDDRRYGSEFKDASELAQLKQDLSRRIEKKSEILKKQEELHKEIEDVYKRAVDFTKKAEMYKKSDRSRERDYNNERHRDEHDPKDFNLPTLSRFNEERHSDWKYQRDNIRPKSREGKTSHHHEENKMVESNYPITKSPGSKTKREKACEAVSEKILTKFGDMLPKDISVRVFDELKYAVSKIFKAMFGDEDVSFIEMIIKFNSKHSTKDEEKIYDSILSSFPSQYRILKRSAKDEPSDIPAKLSKKSPIREVTKEPNSRHEERYKYVSHKKRSLSQRKEDKQTPFTLKGSSGKTQAYTESVDSVKEQSDKSVANSKTADNAMQQEIEDMFPQEGSEDMKQLGPVTTRILEHELRHIMIKVWQEFPDEPPTEEEKFVVEKFRNEAGDDIRDIIGLNVTKRLLKVHNKLIVKVCFLSRPERAHILAFLKKYRISGFKRITSENNTFAARLKRIEDFDKLCSDKEIICGNAELTITPCYKFIKRPANLITKFLDNSHDENPIETADKRVIEKKAQTKVKSASEEIQERDKSLPTTSFKKDVANKKNESEIDYKQNTETTTQKSNNVKLDVPTKNMDRVQPLPKLVNKTAAFDKTSIDKPQSTKLLKDLPSEPQRTMAKVPGKCNKNVSISKEYERIKPCKGTENIENTKVTKKDHEKPKNYEKFKKQTIEKVKKPAYNKELPSKKIQTKDVINKYEDYEEMDDEDILALLSEGVLLDQCGSDDE